MAGHGPAPKPQKIRQNRTKHESATALPPKGRTAAGGRRLPVPVLEPSERDWHKMTRGWWEVMWRSPQASQWLDTDRYALFVLAVLVEAFYRGADLGHSGKDLAAEIRLQEARFGVTVADRARMHWTIEADEPVNPRRAAAAADDDEIDPRDALEFPTRSAG